MVVRVAEIDLSKEVSCTPKFDSQMFNIMYLQHGFIDQYSWDFFNEINVVTSYIPTYNLDA